jgi:hypothetical protein
MKILKYTLLSIALLMIGFMVYLYTIDGKYDTSRSLVMKAPVEKIFPLIVDFKNWPQWSPWAEAFGDGMDVKYEGNEYGVGSKYSWDGEESGKGYMETIEVNEFNEIKQLLFFETPFEVKSDIYWLFEDTEDGTKVTWGMKGEMDFWFKPFASGMDANMEESFNRGLAKLDSISNFYVEEEIFTTDH